MKIRRQVERQSNSLQQLPPDTKQELGEIRRLFRKAADQGDANAQYNLGLMIKQGMFGTVDVVAIRALYEQAAAQGHALATVNLANMMQGGSAQDLIRARELYEQAAKADIPEAYLNLGSFYLAGDGGLAQSYTQARKCFEAAAALGLSEAMFRLGDIWHRGYGVPKNLNKAREWHRQAAEQGHMMSAFAYDALTKFSDADLDKIEEMERRRKQEESAQAQGNKSSGLTPGTKFEVIGLVNRPELNGQRGTVRGYVSATGRWEVELDGKDGCVALKTANMKLG